MTNTRDVVKHILGRHEAYLNGPVPADLLYGPADREPIEVLVDEIMAIKIVEAEAKGYGKALSTALLHLHGLASGPAVENYESRYSELEDLVTTMSQELATLNEEKS